jgi:hypothetical protein
MVARRCLGCVHYTKYNYRHSSESWDDEREFSVIENFEARHPALERIIDLSVRSSTCITLYFTPAAG